MRKRIAGDTHVSNVVRRCVEKKMLKIKILFCSLDISGEQDRNKESESLPRSFLALNFISVRSVL